MSHAGNWHRNPRKMALEISRQAERDRAAAAAGGEVTFYQVNRHPVDLFALHPCRTEREEWITEATCFGCRAVRTLQLEPLIAGALAHAPWPKIMPLLKCSACGGRPEEIAFFHKGFDLVSRHFVGKITARRPSETELEALSPGKRKIWEIRTFSSEELVFKRLPRW